MKSAQTDFPATEFWRPVDQPTTLFARSGLPGRFPDERETKTNVVDEDVVSAALRQASQRHRPGTQTLHRIQLALAGAAPIAA